MSSLVVKTKSGCWDVGCVTNDGTLKLKEEYKQLLDILYELGPFGGAPAVEGCIDEFNLPTISRTVFKCEAEKEGFLSISEVTEEDMPSEDKPEGGNPIPGIPMADILSGYVPSVETHFWNRTNTSLSIYTNFPLLKSQFNVYVDRPGITVTFMSPPYGTENEPYYNPKEVYPILDLDYHFMTSHKETFQFTTQEYSKNVYLHVSGPCKVVLAVDVVIPEKFCLPSLKIGENSWVYFKDEKVAYNLLNKDLTVNYEAAANFRELARAIKLHILSRGRPNPDLKNALTLGEVELPYDPIFIQNIAVEAENYVGEDSTGNDVTRSRLWGNVSTDDGRQPTNQDGQASPKVVNDYAIRDFRVDGYTGSIYVDCAIEHPAKFIASQLGLYNPDDPWTLYPNTTSSTQRIEITKETVITTARVVLTSDPGNPQSFAVAFDLADKSPITLEGIVPGCKIFVRISYTEPKDPWNPYSTFSQVFKFSDMPPRNEKDEVVGKETIRPSGHFYIDTFLVAGGGAGGYSFIQDPTVVDPTKYGGGGRGTVDQKSNVRVYDNKFDVFVGQGGVAGSNIENGRTEIKLILGENGSSGTQVVAFSGSPGFGANGGAYGGGAGTGGEPGPAEVRDEFNNTILVGEAGTKPSGGLMGNGGNGPKDIKFHNFSFQLDEGTKGDGKAAGGAGGVKVQLGNEYVRFGAGGNGSGHSQNGNNGLDGLCLIVWKQFSF